MQLIIDTVIARHSYTFKNIQLDPFKEIEDHLDYIYGAGCYNYSYKANIVEIEPLELVDLRDVLLPAEYFNFVEARANTKERSSERYKVVAQRRKQKRITNEQSSKRNS